MLCIVVSKSKKNCSLITGLLTAQGSYWVCYKLLLTDLSSMYFTNKKNLCRAVGYNTPVMFV